MMAETFDLEELVHLEQTFYDTGYTDGFAHGRIHGLIEGRSLGRQKGFEIWEEIGFYEGFATTWKVIYEQRGPSERDQRAVHHIKHLLELIRQFPTVNPSTAAHTTSTSSEPDGEIDISKLQRQIRSRYKALCASLGVRPTLRSSEGVHATPGEEEGVSVNDAAAQGSSKRAVWTLEHDARRSIMQGLSF